MMIEEFLSYCKNPAYKVERRKITVKIFIKLYLMCMLTVVFISVPLSTLSHLLDVTNDMKNTTTQFILYGIFIAPVLEEILFRLLLIPVKINVYIYSFVIVLWIIILSFFTKYLLAGIITIVFTLTLILIFLGYKHIIKLNNNFKFLFYLSAGLFALVHISNFEGISLFNFFIIPVFVLPQLVMGLVFGYARMIYGFRYSVFLHICVNMVALSGYLLMNILNNSYLSN